jgi:amino acid transporter
MAQDGLLFKIYKRVNPKTGVPTIGSILTGIFTALVACFLDLATLANAISLGTLQVFTFVNAGIILLRMNNNDDVFVTDMTDLNEVQSLLHQTEAISNTPPSPIVQDPQAAAAVRNLGLIKEPSWRIRLSSVTSLRSHYSIKSNGTKPIWLILVFTVCATLASVVIENATSDTSSIDQSLMLGIVGILGFGMLLSAGWLHILPQSLPPDTFACPLVPTVPLLGILSNCYMMGSLPSQTWWIIAAWLTAGLFFYFVYGIHHSELNVRNKIAPKKDNVGAGIHSRPTTASINYQSI